MAGYKAGIEAAGGTFLSDETQYANAVADQAVTCMEAIIQNHPEGIAVICANNDDMAIGAIEAIKEKGYRIPQDIAVFGFSNSKRSRYMTPSVSTINQFPEKSVKQQQNFSSNRY